MSTGAQAAGGGPSAGAAFGPRGVTPAQRGWIVFGGAVMLISGVLGIMQGIAAIVNDDVFRGVGDYVFAFDLTGWGVIHLVLGVLVAVIGYGVLNRRLWARYAGLFVVSMALVAYFLWLPFYPVWAIVAIALNLAVIWALAGWTVADTP